MPQADSWVKHRPCAVHAQAVGSGTAEGADSAWEDSETAQTQDPAAGTAKRPCLHPPAPAPCERLPHTCTPQTIDRC